MFFNFQRYAGYMQYEYEDMNSKFEGWEYI